MQSVDVFLDIARFADFRWKLADVNETQGVCHVFHIIFGIFKAIYNCAKFHHRRICVTDFKEWGKGGGWYFWPLPFVSSPRKTHPEDIFFEIFYTDFLKLFRNWIEQIMKRMGEWFNKSHLEMGMYQLKQWTWKISIFMCHWII